MISTAETVRTLLADLTALLDEETALLELRRRQLSDLGVAIVAADDEALGALLEEMEQAQVVQMAADRRLRNLRGALAGALGCRPEDIRLSGLIERLSGEQRAGLAARRQRLRRLADDVRREHIRAAMLLVECARINRELMNGLFPHSKPVTTYSTGGPVSWRLDTGLLDTES